MNPETEGLITETQQQRLPTENYKENSIKTDQNQYVDCVHKKLNLLITKCLVAQSEDQ